MCYQEISKRISSAFGRALRMIASTCPGCKALILFWVFVCLGCSAWSGKYPAALFPGATPSGLQLNAFRSQGPRKLQASLSDKFHACLGGMPLLENLQVTKDEAKTVDIHMVHQHRDHDYRLVESLSRRILRRAQAKGCWVQQLMAGLFCICDLKSNESELAGVRRDHQLAEVYIDGEPEPCV